MVALNNSQYYRLTTGGTALSASILIKITAGFMSLLSIFLIEIADGTKNRLVIQKTASNGKYQQHSIF